MSSLAQIQVGLFGAFSCKWANGDDIQINSAKQRALIAILATAAKGTHTRSWFQEVLWSLAGDEHARASLCRALSDLRKKFGDRFDTLFVVTNFDICLRPEFVSLVGNRTNGVFLEGINLFEAGFRNWLADKRTNYQNAALFDVAGVGQPVLPTIAVVPFTPRFKDDTTALFSDLLVQEVTRSISRSRMVDVISHLSSRKFDGRQLRLDDVRNTIENRLSGVRINSVRRRKFPVGCGFY